MIHPQLTRLEQEMHAATVRFHRLVAETTDEKWARRAAPDRWSVAECIAHLNLTSRSMVPLMQGAWDKARVMGGATPAKFRSSFVGAMLASMVGPIPGWARFLRMKTPPPFVPTGDQPRGVIVDEYERWRAEQHALLKAADQLPIDRVRIESPFRAGTFYDGYSALKILIRHEHRHLGQAERA